MTDRLREALAEVSAAARAFLESATDYEQLLATIARSCAHALHSTGMVTLFDDGGETMTHVAAYDDDPACHATYQELVGRPRPIDAPLFLRLQAEKVIFLPELDVQAMRPGLAAETYRVMAAQQVTGMISVQLRVNDDALGTLTVLRHGDRPPFDDLDRDLVVHIASVAAMAIANARLMRRAHSIDALRESEQRAVEARIFLDAIIENIPHVVFVKDAVRLSYLRVNRATETLLQLTRAQVIGKNDFDFFPRSVAEFLASKDREALETKQLVDVAEERITTPSGERWLHTKKVPLVGTDGEPRYLLGIAEDITAQKRDLAALASAKDAAEGANRELEAFAHHLCKPLRELDGFGRTLLAEYGDKLDEVGRGHCTRIRTTTQQMSALLDALLARTR